MSLKDLSDREVSHILAALRHWQMSKDKPGHEAEEIATSEGDHTLMSMEEIDRLCERLNCREVGSVCTDCVEYVVKGLLDRAKRLCDDAWSDIPNPCLDALKLRPRVQACLASAAEDLNMAEYLACLIETADALQYAGRIAEIQADVEKSRFSSR